MHKTFAIIGTLIVVGLVGHSITQNVIQNRNEASVLLSTGESGLSGGSSAGDSGSSGVVKPICDECIEVSNSLADISKQIDGLETALKNLAPKRNSSAANRRRYDSLLAQKNALKKQQEQAQKQLLLCTKKSAAAYRAGTCRHRESIRMEEYLQGSVQVEPVL